MKNYKNYEGCNMNYTQRVFWMVLNESIHKRKLELKDIKRIDFEELLQLAINHNVASLVYYGLNRTNTINIMPKDVVNKLKRETVVTSLSQNMHINNIENVLKEFRSENIDVVVLKGLVIRAFYPRPEFRTMSDADIVVKKENLESAINVLEKLGYLENGRSDVDICFVNNNSRIELHWNLISKNKFNGGAEFEEEFWNRVVEVEVGDSKALSLNYEDLAVHLVVHLFKHLAYKGCGIRYFSDLVVLFENKEKEINWESFMEKIRKYNLEKSTRIILYICKKYLGMNINYQLDIEDEINEQYLEWLLNDIRTNGVFGKSNISEELARSLSFYSDNELSPIRKYISVFLPPVEKVRANYKYAEKFKILIPFAYIHRILKWTFDKSITNDNKKSICTKGLSIIKEKKIVMDWLELN